MSAEIGRILDLFP
jgi:hypothetical protein